MQNKSQHSRFNIQNSTQGGAFLLELLIVIALLAVILGVGTQAVYVSLQSGKIAGERDVAVGLASESLEAVRGMTEENWQGIYNLTKGSQYQTVKSGNKWATSTATETIALNNATYTRSFIVENVCRNDTVVNGSRDITGVAACASGSSDDPSTQKVTVTISWTGADPVTISEYFFRLKNKACAQMDWSGGRQADSVIVDVANCSAAAQNKYYLEDMTIATSTASGGLDGQLQLK